MKMTDKEFYEANMSLLPPEQSAYLRQFKWHVKREHTGWHYREEVVIEDVPVQASE